MAVSSSTTERLFFALWPPAAVQQHAHRIAREQVRRGRLLPAANLHITLAFLGDVPPAHKASALAVAEAVERRRFRVELNRFGCWRRRGIAWLAPAEIPEALDALHASLSDGLAAAGLAVDRRRFRPHVTVARRAVAAPALAVEPVSWTVTEFRLMRSQLDSRGARYTTEAAWALAAQG